jgi:hypothetical protein
MTKTKLHEMGYRKGRDCYFKTRCVRTRPNIKATVQVQFREHGHGWYDVRAIESGMVNSSEMLKGVRQLRQWESFAFCT